MIYYDGVRSAIMCKKLNIKFNCLWLDIECAIMIYLFIYLFMISNYIYGFNLFLI